MDTANLVAENVVDNMNSTAPPTCLGQISVGPPQNEAHVPEEPVIEDNEADYSSLDEVFLLPRPPRPTTKPMSTLKVSCPEPSILAPGRHKIENRNEALNVPFTQVSDSIRCSLDQAEKTKGGPKRVLAKLTAIARTQAKKEIGDGFNSDEESPNSHEDLLECIRRMMVVEAVIRESSAKLPKNKKGKGAHKLRMLSSIPHGGLLNMKGGPDESVPLMEDLNIQEYSNETYWRFAPYLEDVCCTLKAT